MLVTQNKKLYNKGVEFYTEYYSIVRWSCIVYGSCLKIYKVTHTVSATLHDTILYIQKKTPLHVYKMYFIFYVEVLTGTHCVNENIE